MEQNKSNKVWIKNLRTGSEDVILQTLDELRISGNNNVLPEIMAILKGDPGEKVEDAIYKLLNDLNEQSSGEILIQNLSSFEDEKCFYKLISACWQNGLDYSNYMEYFVDIVLKKDYACAFEAFTMVENNISELENKKREEIIKKIKKGKSIIAQDKLSLLEELECVVEAVSRPVKTDPSP